MKSAGTDIVPIRLPGGLEVTGKVAKHVAGAGPVYIRAHESIIEREETDSDLEEVQVGARDIRQFVTASQPTCTSSTPHAAEMSSNSTTPVTGMTCSDEIPACSSTLSGDAIKAQLQAMFPNTSQAAINNTVDQALDLSEAIDQLLSRENDGHTNNGSTNPGNTNNRNTSNQSASPESAEECYPLRIGRMAPHEAVMVHKSVFVSPLSQPVFFDRRNEGTILRELFRKLKRRELNIMKTPDITFINEDGIDAEGLSKEFFAMVSAALSGGCGGYTLFEGSPDHLLPVISEEFHQSDYFVYVGKLIGLCVLHGGAGVVGLSRALAVYMVTAEIEMASSYMSIEDVPDYSIREKILQNAEDNESLQSLAAEEDVSLILYQAGFGNRTLTISNKGEAIQCILFHQVIKSRRDQIADLVHGLDTTSILELIRMNDACLSVVFPLTSEVAISESEFIGRLEYAQGLQANEKDVIT